MDIIDPSTNSKYNILTINGKKILKQYIRNYFIHQQQKQFGGASNRKNTNLCESKPEVCYGNLGHKREEMPQIETPAELSSISNLLKQHINSQVSISNRTIDISKLKAGKNLRPIQNQLSTDIIHRICQNPDNTKKPTIKPIFITGDKTPTIFYVLDGHHRTFGNLLCNKSKNTQLDIFQIKVVSLTSKQASQEIMEILNNKFPNLFKSHNI